MLAISVSFATWRRSLYISLFCLSLACCFVVNSSYANTLRVIQGEHPLDEYAIGALRVALAHTDTPYQLDIRRDDLTQTRVIEEANLKRVDVIWLASDQASEDILEPVRFPLLKGLLGYRVCIIKPENQTKFSAINDRSALQSLTFGQGYGWPDVEILSSNQLQVITTSKYDNLFYMTEGGRFDGFPRGVLEPWLELKKHEHLDLAVDTHVLLVYKLPFYLFVAQDNAALAAELHQGFDRALATGAFDAYFYSHEMIKGALQKAKLESRKAFYLNNPTLPSKTPLHRLEYWLNVETND